MKIEDLQENWDLIIIGGGVTGAGILREAVRMNLDVLLLEQKDFAWGTSSRSSKLVHGGLRYLKQGKFWLTRDAVTERERLLREAPGLVEPLDFLIPIYSDHGPGKWLVKAGLSLYDIIAMNWRHEFYSAEKFSSLLPNVRKEKLIGGFRFADACVDDARLVLRLISEALAAGGYAVNYVTVNEIIRDIRGNVVGLAAEDTETGAGRTFSTRAVINATGAWAEKLHPSPKPGLHLRPLRGSHLIFPSHIIPIDQAVSLAHPEDNRPVFAIPWEGAIIFGTTDYDHNEDLSAEPVITEEEISYLMEALRVFFPSSDISLEDCISTIAGVRPVLSKGKSEPSKESREHVVWTDKGLVTITGGKLTTFRKLAWDTLKAAESFLPLSKVRDKGEPVFSFPNTDLREDNDLSPDQRRYLCGRYGRYANDIVEKAAPEDLTPVPGTRTIWAELPFAARYEQVRHLTDLLLRRVRIGLLTPGGGEKHLGRIRRLCEPVLSWDENQWEEEIGMYLDHWEKINSKLQYPNI
ncbi:glycerol-3-phosphate dehydrogenase/oxidase [Desulfococcaceae bacterium HSG8]|nr:glycerol-3-phosphate dehydrogenase/oxidase [Desulfococcaceae bacterium HSG8]